MGESLAGRRLLLVEDHYLIAEDFRAAIEDAGGTVIGPAGMVGEALALIAGDPGFDAAIIDLDLHGESSARVIDAVVGLGKLAVITTGYGAAGVPDRHRGSPLYEKPLLPADVVRALARLLAG